MPPLLETSPTRRARSLVRSGAALAGSRALLDRLRARERAQGIAASRECARSAQRGPPTCSGTRAILMRDPIGCAVDAQLQTESLAQSTTRTVLQLPPGLVRLAEMGENRINLGDLRPRIRGTVHQGITLTLPEMSRSIAANVTALSCLAREALAGMLTETRIGAGPVEGFKGPLLKTARPFRPVPIKIALARKGARISVRGGVINWQQTARRAHQLRMSRGTTRGRRQRHRSNATV
jgi:hypothetical protein